MDEQQNKLDNEVLKNQKIIVHLTTTGIKKTLKRRCTFGD